MPPRHAGPWTSSRCFSANEVGVNLKQGYNGDLTSREAGSIDGQMVKNISPIQTRNCKRPSRAALGHVQQVAYIAEVSI